MARRLRHRALAGLVCVALLAACGGGSSSPTEPGGDPTPQIEQQSFSLLNGARSASDLNLLGLSPPASGVARAHSAAMRDFGFFGHRDPQGRTLKERLQEAGIPHSAAAENLAMVTGASDPAQWVHDHLMASAEHREHILDSDFVLAGVGVATHGSTVWVTQIFLRP